MKHTFRRRLITFLGGSVYLLWAGQWLWLTMLYVESFARSGVGKTIISPDGSSGEGIIPGPGPEVVIPGSFSPFIIVLSVVLALAVILLVGYIIARVYVPGVQQVAKKAVQKTAEVTAERAVHSHMIQAKKRPIFTARVVFWLKVMACLMPVIIVFVVPGITPHISDEVARAGVLAFALAALVLTISQHALMRRWRIKETTE